MTRTLSNLLDAHEADLRLRLNQLERVSGHQNTDIKLSVEVLQSARQKVRSLGLDQDDTTAKELYHTLLQRVSDDDRRLERALQTRAATYVSAEAQLMDGMTHALEQESAGTTVMALKPAAARRLLKKLPAKRLLKALGYRSFDALLRQESPALIVAAALHIESAAWRKSWLDSYKQLKPADFETRKLQVLHPAADRWQAVATKIVAEQAHTVLAVSELGALVLLPLPAERPAGMVVATMALALHELNSLTAVANYIRAAQVQPDFGARIKAVANNEVHLETPHMPQALPWQLLQRYFATTKAVINEDIFGPYVQAVDFAWKSVEHSLSRICPALAFWEDTAHLTFLHEGQAVSLNIVDAAINACNQLSYEARGLYHAQQALWGELCLRYLNHESVEQAVAALFRPQLATEMAGNN